MFVALELAVLILSPAAASGVRSGRSAPAQRLAGSLDPSFGQDGIVTRDQAGIEAIAVQLDGKIVVAGGDFELARYLPDGSPDPSFGDGGHVETPFADGGSADAVVVQADGKIVAAGSSGTPPAADAVFAVARYNPDGSLDASFGTGGTITTAFPEQDGSASFASVFALAALPGGEILAGGTAGFENDAVTLPTSSFALARYEPDGTLDPAFGDHGIVQTRFDGNLGLYGMFVRPDGTIVAAGDAAGPGHGLTFQRMAIARYKPDGSIDPAFGISGKVASPATLDYSGGPSTLQGGKIVVTGETHNGVPVLARYTARGRLDSTFGKRGFRKVKRLKGGSTAVLAQKDGKILLGTQFGAVVRLTSNGRLDPSFGTRGVAAPRGVGPFAVQADGKILVGGSSGDASTLVRLIGGNNCIVPRLRGRAIANARAELESSYCRTGHISRRFSSTVTRGRVISTAPPRGGRLPGHAKVDLIVSRGRNR